MKKTERFVPIGTFLVYGAGFVLTYFNFTEWFSGNYGIYWIGGIFSVIMLFRALTEEGFNPGNYLFYCVIVLIGGIVIDTILKSLVAKGVGIPLFLGVLTALLAVLSLLSLRFYASSMAKGKRDAAENDDATKEGR